MERVKVIDSKVKAVISFKNGLEKMENLMYKKKYGYR